MKILVLDCETKPITALVWGLFNQNISLNQIRENGGILCVGLKWLGDKRKHMFSVWEHGYEDMLRSVHSMLSEAEAVITYNGSRFDIPKLLGGFAEIGLPPPPPITSIDVYKSVKKLGLISNKLAFVGPFFKIGQKINTGGMELWTGAMDGDKKSQKKMERYCIQDVVLLENVYKRLLPYMDKHPNIGNGHSCAKCGSNNTQSRGWRLTAHFRIQRIQCQSCGGWGDGKREKIS